ncbi:flagellin [Amphiplicatus metriothermophilus]|uniref:Flagellin n=1 Tax=Amphiplicatus metriothermophilus TaxID=1519374 RepID=A0A239PLW2_9PROT|nr:flagellin [Amphiplicatus metriothermophilus]MBB5517325.1 flagellin [Amphiplicatus metriothermophilus]SNT68339.1 flagellin [Amphiplicatus metriothermophilus]
MVSILNNESATVALATLRSINRNLAQVQQEISTGKSVANAKDNAAIYAVSTVIQSDADSFEAISSSLNLGLSTVGVARAAAENVTSLLQDIKNLVVAAQEENIDRSKIQTDIAQLRDQITSIVNAAQFSGLNLLRGGGSVDILSSLDRAADGTVTASNITIARNNLEVAQQTFGAGAGNVTTTVTGLAVGTQIDDGETATITYTATEISEGESFRITLGGTDYDYVARNGDTLNDVVRELKERIDAAGIANVTVTASNVSDPTSTDSVLTINYAPGDASNLTFAQANNSGGTAGGDLGTLLTFDVTTSAGAEQALTDIEALIQTGIDAAAAFGSAQKRIEIQEEFVTALVDNLKSGISALTDADIEEASARLQSLQVQQQLGIQALAIANQTPQTILSLFR